MMSYAFIAAASILFASQFLFNQKYTKSTGSTLMPVLLFTLSISVFGFIFQFALNGFRLDITPFSAVCAFILAALWVSGIFADFKSLESINLSAYSVFLMLGGMILPSVYGIIFLNEELSVFKLLCFILAVVAILFTIDSSQKSGNVIFYLFAFLSNGLINVCLNIHERVTAFEATNSRSFLMLSLIIMVLMCLLIFIPTYRRTDVKIGGILTKKCLLYTIAYAACNNFGNLLLMVSMKYLPASVQSSLATSGVMFVSLLISLAMREKVSRKNIAATTVALIATILFAL